MRRPDPPAPLAADSGYHLLRTLPLRQVHHFVTLCEELNYQRASQRLALTPPALNMSIKGMERQLETTLFTRKGNHIALSDVGKQIWPIAEHLLNTATAALEDMSQLVKKQKYTVRIGLVPSVAGWITQALAELEARQPEMSFEIIDHTAPALLDAVMRRTVDIGIGVNNPAIPSPLISYPLLSDDIVALIRGDSSMAAQGGTTWERLADEVSGHFINGGIVELMGGNRAVAQHCASFSLSSPIHRDAVRVGSKRTLHWAGASPDYHQHASSRADLTVD